jgi:SNF2 family DNA or RNA helicase
MDIVHEMAAQAGITVLRIDGSVSKEDRTQQIQKFRKCETQCVFIIQIKAGGQGLNLQEATRVYITSPSWNPATELQAIGRAHRTGQTKKVYVRKLIYAGEENLPSIEQSIMALQGHKAVTCSEVLNDPRLAKQIPSTKSTISIKTLQKIFSA